MEPFLLKTLQTYGRRTGRPLFLVGGPPRDLFLNRSCHDWDLATRQARRAAQALARALKAKFIPLDEENRIYRVVAAGPALDSGRPATVDFAELQGGSIETDLARRDFTINAMAIPVSSLQPDFTEKSLIDPWGGRRDIERRLLRAVSKKAFTDDPLRLLRAFRFCAQFNLSIEPQTARWIKEFSRRIRQPYLGVSPERVREELLRLLSQRPAGPTLVAMDRHGLLKNLFPEMEPCRRTAVRYHGRGGVLKHCLQTVANLDWILDQIQSEPAASRTAQAYCSGLFPGPGVLRGVQDYLAGPIGGFARAAWLKLAGFLHDIGKPATVQMKGGRLRFFGHEDVGAEMAKKVIEGLRASRLEAQTIRAWVRHHMRPGNLAACPRLTDKAIARFFRDLREDGVGMLLVSLADHYCYLPPRQWGKAKDAVERASAALWDSYFRRRGVVQPARLLDGHVLMRRLHLKPGPLIGKLLEEVRDAQAEGKVHTPEEAVSFGKKKLPRLRERLEKRRAR